MSKKQEIKRLFFLKPEDRRSDFGHTLIRWYRAHSRDLPWRQTQDPYRIWLSEIILQQTRVAQGLPYYNKFLEAYPDVFALAAAPEKDVLWLWQGLGYYSRARNMLRTARILVEKYDGKFPGHYEEILQLKGIGDYTASAIAAFAFNRQVVTIDGNAFRVLSRYLGITEDIAGTKARSVFKEAGMLLMPEGEAGLFNQALMEFGALQCVPVAPDCPVCPLHHSCYAFRYQMQAELPVKSRKTKVRDRHIHYLVINQNGKTALRERKGKDIWTGLYDFFSVEPDLASADRRLVLDLLPPGLAAGELSLSGGPVKHILTHLRILAYFWTLELPEGNEIPLPENVRFYSDEEIHLLPKPVLISTYLNGFPGQEDF